MTMSAQADAERVRWTRPRTLAPALSLTRINARVRMRAQARASRQVSERTGGPACGCERRGASAAPRTVRCGVLLLALVWTNAVAGARAAASSPTPVVLVQHAADLAAPAPPLDGIAAQVLGGSRAAAHAFFGEAFERRPRLWRAADRGAAGKAFAARAGAMLPLEHIAGALHANVSATGKLGAPPQPLVYGMGGDLMLARAHAGETQMLGNFWSHSGKAVSAEVVDAALANGFSIVFNQMHTRSGALAEAAGALAAHLGAFVGVNVYVTPAGMADAPDEDELSTSARAVGATAAARQGFGLHFDEMESFVVQLSGTKH